MEEGQVTFIRNNWDLILRSTAYSDLLLEPFLGEGILTSWDIQIIGSKKTDVGKVAEFYRLILTRANAYPVLLQALVEGGQEEFSKAMEENVPLTPEETQLRARIILRKAEARSRKRPRPQHPDLEYSDHEEPEPVSGGLTKRARFDPEPGDANVLASEELGDGADPSSELGDLQNVRENSLEECLNKLVLVPVPSKVEEPPQEWEMESTNLSTGTIPLPQVVSSDANYNLSNAQGGSGTILEFGGRSPADRTMAVFKMRQFLDMLATSSTPLVAMFRIIGRFLFMLENQRLMREFLQLCGPQAETLFFSVNSSLVTANFDVGTLPPILDLGLLTKLALQLMDPGGSAGYDANCKSHGIASFMERLFDGARALREFRFDFELLPKPKFKVHQILSVPIRHFENIITRRLPKSVTTLILNMPVSNLAFQNLAESGLKLEEFQFHAYSTLDHNLIHSFLESQVDCLRIFRAFQYGPEERATMLHFPKLKKLIQLELQRVKVQDSFAEKFPTLNLLNFSTFQFAGSFKQLLEVQQGLESGFAHTTANQLHLPGAFPMARMVKRVADCFPCITELHVAPCPDIGGTLEEVFTHFCSVERLFITFPTPEEECRLDVDCLLGGCCMDDLERIFQLWKWDDGKIDLKKWQRVENILNMTKLKKLSLTTEELPSARVSISAFSAHFLFLQMACLEELCLDGFPYNAISPNYLERLQRKLNLTIK